MRRGASFSGVARRLRIRLPKIGARDALTILQELSEYGPVAKKRNEKIIVWTMMFERWSSAFVSQNSPRFYL
jgi:hypothetical protein